MEDIQETLQSLLSVVSLDFNGESKQLRLNEVLTFEKFKLPKRGVV